MENRHNSEINKIDRSYLQKSGNTTTDWNR